MKILVITGLLAEDMIKLLRFDPEYKIDVLALPVTVASFITAKYAVKQLAEIDLSGYDFLLMPGTTGGDLSDIEAAVGVPVYRGPIHAADLPLVLSGDIQLSKTQPANELIKSKLEENAFEVIDDAENNWRDILARDGGFEIGNLPVSYGLPMRVIGEIVNAPNMGLTDVKKRAVYFESQGADIIDIGMLAGNPKPEKVSGIVNAIRESVDLPISIDSLNTDEIKASIDSGIDMILSLDLGNLDSIAPKISDEAVVVLPTNMSKGLLPRIASERVKILEETISKLQELGIEKIIGDLVVEPLLKPGLLEGLKAFQLFYQKNPEIPLLYGVGNAVELIDADSPGVHAALIALAREAGSSILHVPEYSVKARGSISEAVTASRMMFLAERRDTVLKDLGLDLLLLKEKRWKEIEYNLDEKGLKVLEGVGETEYYPDKTGWFKIQVDRKAGEIVAIFYPKGCNEPSTVIRGAESRTIYQTIIREKLITKHDHAAYLGKELEKAVIALKLGRSYVQDSPLF